MEEQRVVCVSELGYIDREGNWNWHETTDDMSPVEARLEALELQVAEMQRTIDDLVSAVQALAGR